VNMETFTAAIKTTYLVFEQEVLVDVEVPSLIVEEDIASLKNWQLHCTIQLNDLRVQNQL
jgi:hypothetical protein